MTLHPTPNRAEPDDDTVVPDPVVEIEYDANQLRHLLDTIDDVILSDRRIPTPAPREITISTALRHWLRREPRRASLWKGRATACRGGLSHDAASQPNRVEHDAAAGRDEAGPRSIRRRRAQS